MAVLALSLSFTSCDSGSSDDDEAGGGGTTFTSADFGEVGSNSTFVSDFQMSDVDLLIDFAINCDLLDLEWIRFCSNDFKGDLLSGPGEYSDESFYLEVERDIMANADKYIDALNRLADDGIFDNTTTRGLKDAVVKTGGWSLNLISGARDTQNKMRDILRDMGAFGDKQMQEDIFSCLKEESRGGYKDAHSFFVALNNSETSYEMLLSANQQYAQIDEGIQEIERPGYQTHAKWESSRDKLKVKDRIGRMVDAGKELTNKAIEVEETVVDVMTGGGYSTAKKLDKKAKDTQELLKKLFGGNPDKLTKEQVEEGLNKRGIDKLKSWIPKTGSDNVDAFVKFVADKLGDMALKKDPTGEAAKKNGKTILDIKNNTDEKQKVIVVTGDDGKASVVIPDKDGNGTSVTDPGNKKITAVTKGGKRSTTATTAKKDGGKQEEKIAPESTGTPEIKASVSKLPFKATPKNNENVGTITVTTNCKYFGVKIDGDAKWLNVKKDTKTGLVTVAVKANTDKEPREAKLIIAGSNDKKTTVAKTEVTVTQEAASEGKLSVSRDYIEFNAEGGSDFVVITSEGYEKLAVEVAPECKDWLSASIKSSDSGNEIISVTAKVNNSIQRTGVITLRAGNADKLTKNNSESIEITVEQAGKPLEEMKLETRYVEFKDYKADSKTIGVTGADEVSVICDVDWLSVSATNSTITIKVKENTSPEERVTEIKVTYKRTIQASATSGFAETKEETIMVVQPGNGDYPINGTWEYRQLVAGQTTIYRIEFDKDRYEYSVIIDNKVTDRDSGTFTITDYSERENTTFNYTEIHGKIALGSGNTQTFYTAKFEKNGPLYLIIGSTRYEKK